MIAEAALDYTAYARPLIADNVRRDIDLQRGVGARPPDKIVLWAHQWLWLAYGAHGAKFIKRFIVRGESLDFAAGGTLWGIPVEVRES